MSQPRREPPRTSAQPARAAPLATQGKEPGIHPPPRRAHPARGPVRPQHAVPGRWRAAARRVAAGSHAAAAGADCGAERFGRISSPGSDPGVITAGSADIKGTAARSDDTVDFFGSRGPTRRCDVHGSGVRRIDNLLEPDLVAPGHKIVGAAATGAVQNIANLDDLARTYSAPYSPYGGTPRSTATRGC